MFSFMAMKLETRTSSLMAIKREDEADLLTVLYQHFFISHSNGVSKK
jgi:hypothetical protein